MVMKRPLDFAIRLKVNFETSFRGKVGMIESWRVRTEELPWCLGKGTGAASWVKRGFVILSSKM